MRTRLLPAELLYASGAFGFNVFHQTITLWLIYFYAPPADSGRSVLVPLGLLGLLLGIGRVLDAIDDPLIGHWSDVTRSRWGRRLPFIVGGAPLLLAMFILLWTPPTAQLPWVGGYVFVIVQLYFIAYCLVHQPYEAVLPEIARDSFGRVRVSSLKVTLGMAGAGVGLVGSGLLIGVVGFPGMATVLGLVAIGSLMVGALGVRRLPQRPPDKRRPALSEALRLTAGNRQFLIFVVSQVFFTLALNMLTQLVPYFVTEILHAPQARVSLVTGVFSFVALLSLPVINRVVGKRGKAFTYRVAMASLVILLPGLFFVGQLPLVDRFVQGLVYIGLLGAPMSALLVLPHPFVADIVDDDAARTATRREGMYYGVEDTVETVSFALSALTFGLLLSFFGFSAAHPLGIRLVGPVAGMGVLVGLLIFHFGYRVPEANISKPEAFAHSANP